MQVKQRRLTREEMKVLILTKADELFRRMGFHKAAVADIARELGMSPANIYKFFSSKEAIMDACTSKYAIEIEDRLQAIVMSDHSAIDRLKAIAMEVYRTNRGHFQNEKEIYRLVIAAIDRNWNCIQKFRGIFLKAIKEIIEDGVRKGEFKEVAIEETADAVNRSLQWITHALLFPELECETVEARLDVQMHLLEKGLS